MPTVFSWYKGELVEDDNSSLLGFLPVEES